MEQEASGADEQVATESDEENMVMLVTEATQNALDAQPHEHEVCQGIDDLSGVDSGIVVLSQY